MSKLLGWININKYKEYIENILPCIYLLFYFYDRQYFLYAWVCVSVSIGWMWVLIDDCRNTTAHCWTNGLQRHPVRCVRSELRPAAHYQTPRTTPSHTVTLLLPKQPQTRLREPYTPYRARTLNHSELYVFITVSSTYMWLLHILHILYCFVLWMERWRTQDVPLALEWWATSSVGVKERCTTSLWPFFLIFHQFGHILPFISFLNCKLCH